MKNRGSTRIFSNLVEVHPKNIHIKFETNPWTVREKKSKNKKSSRRWRQLQRRIQPDRYRARKSRVYIAWRYEIHAIIGSLGTVRAQSRFRSHVKSMGDFRLLQITVI